LDIVWHNAVESLVEHRAWLAEDRRGRSRLVLDNSLEKSFAKFVSTFT